MPCSAPQCKTWSFFLRKTLICFLLKPVDSRQRTSSDTFFTTCTEFTFRSLLNLFVPMFRRELARCPFGYRVRRFTFFRCRLLSSVCNANYSAPTTLPTAWLAAVKPCSAFPDCLADLCAPNPQRV